MISKEEQPYEIPDSWVWGYMFFAFAECLDKYRKPVNSAERANRIGKIPYYGATGQVGWIDDFLTDDELVLVGEDGAPFLDLLKNKAYMIQGKAWVNNHAHILKSFYGHFGNLYLLNYLNIFDFSKYVNGTTRLKLTQSKLAEIPIPIPPKKEQQRIVEKIDSLFEKTKKAKELIQEVKEEIEMRKISILNKAFRGELTKNWRRENKTGSVLELLQEIQNEKIKKWEEECREAEKNGSKKPKKIKVSKPEEMIVPKEEEPYKIPDTWKWVKLENIITILGDGLHGTPKYNENGEYYFINGSNLSFKNIVINSSTKKVSTAEYKKYKKNLNERTIFLSINGTLGKTGFYNNEKIILGKSVCYINLCNNCNKNFILYFFRTMNFINYIIKFATGSTIKNVSLNTVRESYIPLPPLEEQQEIVRVLEEVLEKEKKVKELIDLEEKIDLLEKSILDKAFRGKLGTQDKNDEPALELLKKIIDKEE
nr:restriction endonuclease subunit S [Fusobacterium necrophorum]